MPGGWWKLTDILTLPPHRAGGIGPGPGQRPDGLQSGCSALICPCQWLPPLGVVDMDSGRTVLKLVVWASLGTQQLGQEGVYAPPVLSS